MNKKNRPFFSITIPTYEMHGKGVEFLEFNLNKIKEQNFNNFEVIISDHSKNDDIKELCNKFIGEINIKYFKNKENLGSSSANINNAIKLSSGEWIKIIFQDDFLYDENSLKNLKESILENEQHKWFASGCQHTNDGKSFYREFYPKWTEKIYLGENTISSPSVICFKNDKNVFFDEMLVWMMDVDFYKKLYKNYGDGFFINQILVVNRTWDNRLTNTISKDKKNEELNVMIERYN